MKVAVRFLFRGGVPVSPEERDATEPVVGNIMTCGAGTRDVTGVGGDRGRMYTTVLQLQSSDHSQTIAQLYCPTLKVIGGENWVHVQGMERVKTPQGLAWVHQAWKFQVLPVR